MKNQLVKSFSDIVGITDRDEARLNRLISQKTGIINAILRRRELEPYGFSMFQSLSAQASIIFGLSREVSSGGLGVHQVPSRAFWACIGEAIERYCMSYAPSTEITRCKKESLPRRKVVRSHELYSERQYAKHKIFRNPDKEVMDWTLLDEYRGHGKIFWPASLVYLPYDGICAAETSSTGVAAAPNLSKAVLSGLLELLERDALMINYLNRLNPPEVDLSTVRGQPKKLIDKIKKQFSVKLYQLYSDMQIPIYSAVIWSGTGERLHYGIGASAALDSNAAIEKALKECLFTHFYSKKSLHLKPNRAKEITKLYEHFFYYQGANFAKLLFQSDVAPYQRRKITDAELFTIVKNNHLKVYYKILTTPDVAPSGITVAKVVVPGLIDLNKSYVLRRLRSKRLISVPKKLGLRPIISPLPHPFP